MIRSCRRTTSADVTMTMPVRRARRDEVIVDGSRRTSHRARRGRTPTRSMSTALASTIIAERIEYLDENGKLITETLRDYTKRPEEALRSLDAFLQRWKSAERKQAIVEELESEGLSARALAEEVGKDLDPFDLICHVAFDQPAAHAAGARRQRAQARCLHQVRPAGARRARGALAASIRIRAFSISAIRASSRFRRSIRWERRSTDQGVRDAGGLRVRCPRAAIRSLQEVA